MAKSKADYMASVADKTSSLVTAMASNVSLDDTLQTSIRCLNNRYDWDDMDNNEKGLYTLLQLQRHLYNLEHNLENKPHWNRLKKDKDQYRQFKALKRDLEKLIKIVKRDHRENMVRYFDSLSVGHRKAVNMAAVVVANQQADDGVVKQDTVDHLLDEREATVHMRHTHDEEELDEETAIHNYRQTKLSLTDYVAGNAAKKYYSHKNFTQAFTDSSSLQEFFSNLGSAIVGKLTVFNRNKELSTAKLQQMYRFSKGVTDQLAKKQDSSVDRSQYRGADATTQINIGENFGSQQQILNTFARIRNKHTTHIYNSQAAVPVTNSPNKAEKVFTLKQIPWHKRHKSADKYTRDSRFDHSQYQFTLPGKTV